MRVPDSDFSSVDLLLPMTGINGANDFIDYSPNNTTMTVNSATISTVKSDPFNENDGVGSFDGTNDYITSNSLKIPATGAFTIEFWVWFNDLANIQCMVSQYSNTTGRMNFITLPPNDQIQWFINGGTSVWINSLQNSITTNKWHFIEISRDTDNTCRLFVDGNLDRSTVTSNSIYQVDTTYGAQKNGAALERHLDGYMCDVRFTPGLARHTASYDKPTRRLSSRAVAGTITGTLTENVALNDFIIRAYEVRTGQLVGETKSQSGAYSLDVSTLEQCFITATPFVNDKWRASTEYKAGQIIAPTDPATTPHLFSCTTAGATSGTEPTWNTSGTTNDGTAVFTYLGPLVQPVTHGPVVPT